MINTKELYWAAGFLEGEGSFGCWSKSKAHGRYRQFVVCAEQVQREPLERLLKLFGGSINSGRVRDNKNRIFRWRVYSTRARGLAMTLFCLMSPRRKEQIHKMLDNPWRLYEKVI